MAAPLLAPELESIPNRRPLPVEAYYRLMEQGFLEGRFEILDGEVIDKMGQNPPHAVTLSIILEALVDLFGLPYIRLQSPIAIPGQDGIYNEPEPDIVVTADRSSTYLGRHPSPQDLLLVVEISDISLTTDLVLKARLFARARISEYWVVDLTGRRLHIHRAPVNGEYSDVTVIPEGHVVSPIAKPQTQIQVSDLLPRSG
jgi:Uma2 family endonuclease